jgi:two-component system NarL family sensor kinase
MGRSPARLVDFVAAEPVRLSAFLRLPLIGLIVLLVSVWEVEHWLPLAYAVILGAYSVAALAWLVVVLRGPVPPSAGWASTGTDVLTVVALCVVSGGATVALLPVFFLLPISVAFQDRPALAAVVGICTAVGYLGVWIVYSKRDDTVELPSVVYTHFGLLLWLAAAMTALCYFLTRAAARVAALLDMRRTLVSESMRADERHSRALAEQLHDGPLQDLLAARLELDEVRERHTDPGLDAAYRAVQDTAIRLRSTVTALHPQVLTEVGLTAALRELIRDYEHRGNFAIEPDLEDVGRPRSQSLLYRAARELLANAHKHARASTVQVRLARAADAITLSVVDDGIGFDPPSWIDASPKGTSDSRRWQSALTQWADR